MKRTLFLSVLFVVLICSIQTVRGQIIEQLKKELDKQNSEKLVLKSELKTVKYQMAKFDALKSRMAKIEAALQKMEIMTAKKGNENKSGVTETAEVSEGSE